MGAQIHLQGHRLDDLPQQGAAKDLFGDLGSGLAQQDLGKLVSAGARYLEVSDDSIMPMLCSLSSQLFKTVSPADEKELDAMLQEIQAVFKQVVHSVEDLQA